MIDSHALYADNFGEQEGNTFLDKGHDDFVSQVEARIDAMKRAAQELVEELGLPPESKYDVLSAIAMSLSHHLPTVSDFEEIALKAYEAYDNDSEIEEVLKQNDSLIVELMWVKIPRNRIRPALLYDEVEDAVQNVRINVWRALKEKSIRHVRAYINTVIQMECVNVARRNHFLPLPLDEDGELLPGNVVLMTNQEVAKDPATVFEQEEVVSHYIAQTVDAVLKLSPRQQYAMICTIKEKIDDIIRLSDEFNRHGVDIDNINCPEGNYEKQLMYASLWMARKNIRRYLDLKGASRNEITSNGKRRSLSSTVVQKPDLTT